MLEEVKSLEKQMIEDRRYLHWNPELSSQEFHTTQFIKDRLKEFHVAVEPLDISTGVSALIRGAGRGKTICIRHDIDALPISEQTNLDFASGTKGVSHCCGHDIHTVVALYCARILENHREELNGNVRIVFQPAEETGSGAKEMVKAGVMELEPKHDMVVGLHVHPFTPVGYIRLKKGPMEAASDGFMITLKGKSGHGAYPHDCVDPIVASAYLVTQLQTIISRENPAARPAVLTIGSIHGGTTHNSIPEEVVLKGSMRSLYDGSRTHNKEAVRRITEGVCKSMRTEGIVEFFEDSSLPVVLNDDRIADRIIQAAEEMLGKGHALELDNPSMGSDDFSVFLENCPGVQFFLGTANEDENSRIGLHNGANIFDEKSIVVGVAILTRFILDELGGETCIK